MYNYTSVMEISSLKEISLRKKHSKCKFLCLFIVSEITVVVDTAVIEAITVPVTAVDLAAVLVLHVPIVADSIGGGKL